jgi:hypothetical protein
MTFDSTSTRDVEALAWAMHQGAKQSVIAEFCHQRLTAEQQQFLSESFQKLNITVHQGVKIGTGTWQQHRTLVHTPGPPPPWRDKICAAPPASPGLG